MSALAPRLDPTPEPSFDALVMYDGECRTTTFKCRCRIDEYPTLREANVCPEHHAWPIVADLIRYWAAASVILLTLVCA